MTDAWNFLRPYGDEILFKNLNSNHFNNPTYVQKKAIIPLLTHKDVTVIATTGSGKTLAFVIPTIILIQRDIKKIKKHMTCAMVISPTRELAMQTNDEFLKMTKDTNLKPFLIIGGPKSSAYLDMYLEKGGQIMISTPGSLEAILLNSGSRDAAVRDLFISSFQYIEILIVDEADKLLEMGFLRQIDVILSFIPRQRRTGLYSASDSTSIQKLSSACMRNQIYFNLSETRENFVSQASIRADTLHSCLPKKLSNLYYVCESHLKFSILNNFITEHQDSKIIVFLATIHMVEYFGLLLTKLCVNQSVWMLHGKLKAKRHAIYNIFKNSKKGILLCSDLLSRGVDIPQVDWVVQYEPPRKSNTFVHRSGRTARLGTAGNCLTFLYPTEIDYVHFLNINKGIKLKPFTFDSSFSFSDRIKKFATKDRDVYLKGLKAYVSFVNFYTQHECKRIFDIKNLELGKIASDFGLLHLPNMPELEDADLSGFTKSHQDHSTIRFKSKVREKLRQKIIKKREIEKFM